MRQNYAYWLVPLAVLILAALALRPALDVDVFNLLPRDSEVVRGLKTYQENFGSASELLLLVQGSDADGTAEQVAALAGALQAAELTKQAVWQLPTQASSAALTELLAYLWINQPADRFEMMAERFTEAGVRETLESTVERLTLSFQPAEVASLGRDPFELGRVREWVQLPVPGNGEDPFTSVDGRSRLLILSAPDVAAGFFGARRWVAAVKAFLDDWHVAHPDYQIGVTGNPAFVAESGVALVSDLAGAAAGTALLVAVLFWVVHRRWQPLAALVLLLTVVLALTMAVGELIFGELHVVSLGFAAILLGLAADYGLILHQEAKSHSELSVAAQRAAVLPAIGWSSVTTAGAFLMISRSSLPGLTQLGVLVAVGVLIAAVVMLVGYLNLAGKEERPAASANIPAAFSLQNRTVLLGGMTVLGLALVAAVANPPVVNPDARSLALSNGSARATLDTVREEIGGFDDDQWLVLTGTDEHEIWIQFQHAAPLLEAAQTSGLLASYRLPLDIWPRADVQKVNRERLRWLVGRESAALSSLQRAGFTDTATTRGVFEAWRRYSDASGVFWPESPETAWLVRQYAARQPGTVVALGRLNVTNQAGASDLAVLAAELKRDNGGVLVSWTLLAGSLLGAVERDLARVLVPMVAVLLVLLFIAFRRASEVLLSISALAASLLGLLAVMNLIGWQWNLVNVMALPMLFGAGVDYALHVQFAMRRYAGDAVRTRNSVGRAILLCAASTAAGFATLGFADNAGIASLGRICAVGIVITSLVAVFLLPVWWRIMPGHLAADSR